MADSPTKTAGDNADIAGKSFEEALEELKTIVARLEKGEGKLEEAISSYERGMALKAHCQAKLRDAEAKLEKISLAADGTPSLTAMDE